MSSIKERAYKKLFLTLSWGWRRDHILNQDAYNDAHQSFRLGGAVNETWFAIQGEVSLLAHSLGSVLCYDVLCNQSLHSVSSKMDEDQYPVEETNSESLAKMDLQPSVSPLKPLSSVDLDPARAPMVHFLSSPTFARKNVAITWVGM